MVRALILGTLTLAIASVAVADELVLQDGRVFIGTVTVKGETVAIDVPNGTLSFSREQVARIDFKLTPEQEFDKRLSKVSPDDADAMFGVAQWASENGLGKKAQDLCQKVLKLDAEHAGAHHALGLTKIGGKWLGLDEGLELAKSKLQAKLYDAVLKDIVPALAEIADKDRRPAVRDIELRACLGAGKFSQAIEICTDLAKKSQPPAMLRYAAIGEILKENPDGMYVLSDPYPPESVVVKDKAETLPAGPASLSWPLTMEAALRDKAKIEIKAGRELMDQAAKADATDPDAAAGKYAQASKAFDKAEAMVPGIAHSYHVQVAAMRIAALRRDIDADAKKFDTATAALAKRDVTPQAYKATISRLIHHLDTVRESLKNVLEIAKPYPQDLAVQVMWAKEDLRKIDSMRDFLNTELNAE